MSESKEVEDFSLQVPLIVNLGAASLAVASAFMVMISVQLNLTYTRFESWALALVVAYFLFGALGIISAVMMARGKSAGAILGLVCTLAFLGLFWTPSMMGFFALSMLGCAGFAGLSTLLVGVSIPMTRRLEKERKAFFEQI